MQGELFLDEDNSDRGKIGHVDHHRKWCVQFEGVSFHIDSRLSGFTATTHTDERPSRKTIVTTCDGSCKRLDKIPSKIWDEAKFQFATVKRASEEEDLLLPDVTKEQLDTIHSAGVYRGA